MYITYQNVLALFNHIGLTCGVVVSDYDVSLSMSSESKDITSFTYFHLLYNKSLRIHKSI